MTYAQKLMSSTGMVAKNRLYFAKLTENRQGSSEVRLYAVLRTTILRISGQKRSLSRTQVDEQSLKRHHQVIFLLTRQYFYQ